MTKLTQIEVEEKMCYGGIARAEKSIKAAEVGGRADQNPYAKAIMREFVEPLAHAIRESVNAPGRAGPLVAHVALLRPLDPDAVAFLAVRSIIVNLCSGLNEYRDGHRRVGYQIGSTVHSELVLTQIEAAAPELYHTLVRDLGRRMSKQERHRMTVMKMQAKQRGIAWAEWSLGARDQVGLWLLGMCAAVGLVEIESHEMRTFGYKRLERAVTLAPDVLDKVNSIKDFVSLNAPEYCPCVEPPLDWKDGLGGGFHTPAMKRNTRALIRPHPSARPYSLGKHMPIVDAAANALQRTAWRINRKLLAAVKAVAAVYSTEEIVSTGDTPKPHQPDWLTPGMDKATLNEQQAAEFTAWKRNMSIWYTERKLRGQRYSRMSAAIRIADTFVDQPELYFVYFADSRGRMYPMTYAINPQGSDLQKALLEFAVGKPVDTPEAIRWFHVQGANKFGFDKATLTERHAWVVERQDLILSFADDPVNNSGWTEADSPLQFLAWCFEYAAWVRDNDGSFVSHLPISMDGSCNGLQNLSAMLRDEIGGRATNLTANAKMEDIYRHVAEAATERMRQTVLDDPAKESIRQRWLEAGISRTAVKRTVMCTPYGVTKRSATEYVITDYLDSGAVPSLQRTEYRMAAQVLMDFVWPAIGDVIVKGSQAMTWLKKAARVLIKNCDNEDGVICWTSPSGFPATQAYYDSKVHRIRTRLFGEQEIRVLTESEDAAVNQHASGMAPNFVHSMDAAHLHRTAAAARAAGINSLAMIHDDYGTHAADADRLFHIIRQEFVDMYEEHDPIQDLAKRYPQLPAPPEKGSLEIREVLNSPFFFS